MHCTRRDAIARPGVRFGPHTMNHAARTLLILAITLLLAPTLRAEETRWALLELTAGEQDVIGLHVTAESLREAVDALEEPDAGLLLKMSSRGGFLSEVPALAELIASELALDRPVALWIEEASSSAALVALASPVLLMTPDGFLGGHAPFERLGDADLSLVDEDVETVVRVAERCAVLGDRPALIARALVTPTPVAIGASGAPVAPAEGLSSLTDGTEVLTLAADDAVRTNTADAVIADFTTHDVAGLATARLVLEDHRAFMEERLERFRAAASALDRLLAQEREPEPGDRARAIELIDGIEAIALVTPRVARYCGYDPSRVEAVRVEIDRLLDAAG